MIESIFSMEGGGWEVENPVHFRSSNGQPDLFSETMRKRDENKMIVKKFFKEFL